jgi:hypothetical protein
MAPAVRTVYRYLLDQEIDTAEPDRLVEVLASEPFPLRDALGAEELSAQLRRGLLHFEHEGPTRLDWFGDCVRRISGLLALYVVGLESVEQQDGRAPASVQISKYLGRRGELLVLPVTYTVELASGAVKPGHEDVGYLEQHWANLPRWAKDAFRLKFPELKRL